MCDCDRPSNCLNGSKMARRDVASNAYKTEL
jgi:hypothetical protein